jgi:hypothetical protein
VLKVKSRRALASSRKRAQRARQVAGKQSKSTGRSRSAQRRAGRRRQGAKDDQTRYRPSGKVKAMSCAIRPGPEAPGFAVRQRIGPPRSARAGLQRRSAQVCPVVTFSRRSIASSRRSIASICHDKIFDRAASRSNQSARSTSRNACSLPPLGGHSMSKVLLDSSWIEISLSTEGDYPFPTALTNFSQRL